MEAALVSDEIPGRVLPVVEDERQRSRDLMWAGERFVPDSMLRVGQGNGSSIGGEP
jgi:hypothetical protein